MDRLPSNLSHLVIELQAHSTVSDGQLEPAGVVEAAAEAGVTTLALSDHDAVAGVPEAARAAAELPLDLVPALEMSCVHEYADDLHVLGYWIDLEAIAPACKRAQQERVSRAGEIVENQRLPGRTSVARNARRAASTPRTGASWTCCSPILTRTTTR